MSLTSEIWNGQRYDIVAWARDEITLLYHEFGSYTGDWICVSLDSGGTYRIYRGGFGSCSGCDSFEHWSPSRKSLTRQDALAFAKDYPPFVEIPKATMRNLARNRTLMQVFPANERDYSEIPYEEVVRDLTTMIRVREELPIEMSDVLETENQEIKRSAIEAYGADKFVRDAKGEVLDIDGPDQLLKFSPEEVYCYVKDSSTERHYLLRVPPETTRLKEGIAWTFDMTVAQYQPLKET